MSTRHIRAIVDFALSKNLRELQGFLGLTGYFRRFIENYALKARPLHELTRKNVEFEFNKEYIEFFHLLKRELTSFPTLCLYNSAAETELLTRVRVLEQYYSKSKSLDAWRLLRISVEPRAMLRKCIIVSNWKPWRL